MINIEQNIQYGNILAEIKSGFSLQKSMKVYGLDPEQLLENFIILKDYGDWHLNEIYEATMDGTTFYFGSFIVEYLSGNGRLQTLNKEFQSFIIKRLNFEYGKLVIRPENFEDIVTEFFIKTELDFERYPKFSFDYYFYAEDKSQAKNFASDLRLELIENWKNYTWKPMKIF
jgi:hypothetical protein